VQLQRQLSISHNNALLVQTKYFLVIHRNLLISHIRHIFKTHCRQKLRIFNFLLEILTLIFSHLEKIYLRTIPGYAQEYAKGKKILVHNELRPKKGWANG
jgi:hypothetical protein